MNHRLFLSAFNDLADVIQPADQTFTNIGGLIGYHANFITKKKGFIAKVDATITFLPRQSWLYFPVSKLIRRWDRLFITLYLRHAPPEEGHLIETRYAAFRGPKITNADRLNREKISWGGYDFYLYYESAKIRECASRVHSEEQRPRDHPPHRRRPRAAAMLCFHDPPEGRGGPVLRADLSMGSVPDPQMPWGRERERNSLRNKVS